MSDKPVFYEPHPVAPERKRELVAAGYQIIDAMFKPAGHAAEQQEPSDEAKTRKSRKAGADVS